MVFGYGIKGICGSVNAKKANCFFNYFPDTFYLDDSDVYSAL